MGREGKGIQALERRGGAMPPELGGGGNVPCGGAVPSELGGEGMIRAERGTAP